ncbi:uncharacterized protein LOC121372440 [Gigantopelta aegis]|uniref:uncharacterized protein LOC121372440 n=1 Tax=Gigantopelta aegis TaxID=1735272 RepID=UPI001B88784C|nr:uncharacterized protein LOC121372440 [Gigantopelta aegis]
MQKSPEFQKDCFLIRAPLATFDTIDLGDDLPTKSGHPSVSHRGCNKDSVEEKIISVRNDTDNSCLKTVEEEESKPETLKSEKPSPKREFFKFDKKKDSSKKDSPKPDKRKGSPKKDTKGDKCKQSSKKELSKADKKKEKDNKKAKSNTKSPERVESPAVLPQNVHVSAPQTSCSEASYDYEKEIDNYVYIRHEPYIPGSNNDNISQEQINRCLSQFNGEGKKVETVFIPPPTSLNQNKTIPQLQRTSSFSSSSSESDSEISRHIKHRSFQQPHNEHVGNNSSQPLQSPLTLSPELVDPNSITSPSKKKAYQKRLWRQQVKTSPIARPRSTTPISVVTLDEYSSVLSSPENSPLSPTLHLGDKLKITLPADEFSIKPRSPRTGTSLSVSSDDNEESVFEFNEELLFTHTRSALVVDECGNIPSSPRRVLIPPTISPSSYPKLVTASVSGDTEAAPRLLYYQTPSEPAEEENWAVFSDNPDEQNCVSEDSNHCEDLPKPIYAQGECVLPLEEDILTVNINSSDVSGKRNIDIVLSSSSSSTSQPSPSTPEKPTTDNTVTCTNQTEEPPTGEPSTSEDVLTSDNDIAVNQNM